MRLGVSIEKEGGSTRGRGGVIKNNFSPQKIPLGTSDRQAGDTNQKKGYRGDQKRKLGKKM